MALDFPETAHRKTDMKKLRENHDKIDWDFSSRKKQASKEARDTKEIEDMGQVPERDGDSELPEELPDVSQTTNDHTLPEPIEEEIVEPQIAVLPEE